MPPSRFQGKVPDIVAPGLDALFVGINPGFASARAGHHFANPANPFWRLLHESGFIARRLAPEEGRLLLEAGLGVTNLVARESAGVADLTRPDFEQGRTVLLRKVRRYRPRAVVFVGLTAYAAFRNARSEFGRSSFSAIATRSRGRRTGPAPGVKGRILCGEQPGRLAGARVFVVPNPSGRNAHFSYAQMRAAFRGVARALRAEVRRPS